MDTLLAKANTALVQENFKTAIALYTQAIVSSPDLWEAHLHKAIAHISLGEYSEAGLNADKAVALDARNHLGWVYRGKVRFVEENWEQAREDFTRANELLPGCAVDWLNRCQRAMEETSNASN